MSIMSYNGSAVIAMTGNNCVAICSDMRLGVSQQTVATDFQKVFKIHDRMFVGLSGLATDMQTLYAPPPRSLRPERSVVNDTPRERR
jgi:20S proteasome subunit beta 3